MAFADLDDFTARKGPVGEDQGSIVTALLDDASALIRQEVAASTAEWVTDDDAEVPAAVVAVTVSVAFRAWDNPSALSQSSSADTSISYVRGGSGDAMFLTPNDKRSVRRAAGLSGFASVTVVSPYSGDDATEDEL